MVLKAYAVSDYEWEQAVIIFAHHNVVARRLGAPEVDSEFGDVECKRAPYADQYAPGPVPWEVLVMEHGWHLECSGCSRVVDMENDSEGEDEDGDKWVLAPVWNRSARSVHCNIDCCHRHALEIEARRQLEAATLAQALAWFPAAGNLRFIEQYYPMFGEAKSRGRNCPAVQFKVPMVDSLITWIPSDPEYCLVARECVGEWNDYRAWVRQNKVAMA